MRFNDRLQIPANQTLVVKDIRILTHNFSEEPLPNYNHTDACLSILERAVAPLARSCRLIFSSNSTEAREGKEVCRSTSSGRFRDQLPPIVISRSNAPELASEEGESWINKTSVRKGCFVCKAEDDFTLRSKRDLEIVLTETPINMRLSDLRQMMLECSIPTVSFTSGQQLNIWGLAEGEYAHLEENCLEAAELELFRNRHGFTPNWEGTNEVSLLQSGNARGIRVTIDKMTLSLDDYYTFNINEFREEIAAFGEINIPPNQMLIIKDPLLLEVFDRYTNEAELGGFCSFVLNQLVLSLGKCVRYNELSYDFSKEEGFIRVFDSNGVGLQLVPDHLLLTGMYGLGRMMFNDGRMSLKMEPNQKLQIFDIASDELNELDELNGLNEQNRSEENTQNLRAALARFIMRRSPFAFLSWNITDFNMGELIVNTHLRAIALFSEDGFTITLAPSSPVQFIINTIVQMPLSVIQAVKEKAPSGILAVTIEVLWRCMEIAADTSPYYALFSETNQDRLRFLRDEHAEFRAAYLEIVNDANLSAQWNEILRKPEVFFMSIRSQQHPALKALLIEVSILYFAERLEPVFPVHLQEALKLMDEYGFK
jgi:hypothetical protein